MMSELKPVYEVDTVKIWIVKTNPLGLVIAVTGKTGTPTWGGFELNPVEYVVYPEDGIHDVHWVGVPGGGPQVISDAEFESTWIGFPDGQLKGVRVHSGTNSVVSML
jgi:hypothetical protein